MLKFFFKNARQIMEKLVLENEYKIVVPLYGAAFVLSSAVNNRIKGHFKTFE